MNAKSADIVLAKTGSRLEVKWGVYHGPTDDFTRRTKRIPYWGWGFSQGRQFKENKFDYCILLAAEKSGAQPKYKFVLTRDEMNQKMSSRRSIVNPDSFYIEYSEQEDFYTARAWWPRGRNEAEKFLKNIILHEQRWNIMKNTGKI